MVGFTPPPSSPNPPSPLTQALLQWMALMAQNAAPNASGSPPSMASMAPMPDGMNGMNGMIRGPGTGTSDSILARVSNGEYVLPKATVDQVGPQNLDALRQATQPPPPQTVPRFAEGGMTPYGNDLSITDQYQRASSIYNGPPATQPATTPASPTVAPSALPTPSAYATARSGADALDVASGRFDRNYTAPPTAPNAMPQNGLSGLLGALGQQQQQQQNAYTTARGSADPLDVASGRFDRNYAAPRFAGGGLIGERNYPTGTLGDLTNRYPDDMAQEQNRSIALGAVMPLATLMRPTVDAARAVANWLPESSTTQAEKLAARLNPGRVETNPNIVNALNPSSVQQPWRPPQVPQTDAAFIRQVNQSNPPFTDAQVGAGTDAGRAPFAVPPAVPSTVPPQAAAASLTGAGPRLANLPSWGNRIPNIAGLTSITPPTGPAAPIAATTPGPGAGGLSRLDNTAANMALPAMYTSESQPVERAPGLPTAFTPTGPLTGSATAPLYNTRYADVNGNSATITGTDQRVGGGTLSAPDQGNGGTAAGNVAAINSQIAALQSLREARNPGITTGLSAVGASPPSVDVFARPGDSFGDSQMRANQYQSLLQAAGDRSQTRGRGAREALIQSAQGLMAPGLAQLQQQSALAGQQAGLQAALAGHTQAAQAALAGHQLMAQTALAGQTLAHQQAQAALAQQKDLADRTYGLDTLKFADAQQKQGFDQKLAAFKAQPTATRENQLNEINAMYQAALLDKNRGPNDPATKALAQLQAALSKAHYDAWAAALMPTTPPP